MIPDPRLRFGMNGPQISGPGPGLLGRIAAAVAGAVAIAAGILFSFAIVATATAIALVAGTWLWWKTRGIRRQMREQMRNQPPPGGRIIEGEVIRDRD